MQASLYVEVDIIYAHERRSVQFTLGGRGTYQDRMQYVPLAATLLLLPRAASLPSVLQALSWPRRATMVGIHLLLLLHGAGTAPIPPTLPLFTTVAHFICCP
ncbi:hypothetical protein KIL84_003623 [Mauremys mutica]|uniref:Uncharacterized protein n=1 Tax=Mauremys mutica TaxID=74926 RepID=A0A9D3WW88_9SAUR|nr:hypothetical protein KIL84_003623 [Mauremys mutica]